MYAIVETGGKQVRVSAGDTVRIEKISGDAHSEILLDRVLVIADKENTVFGKPYVEGASVKAEIIGAGRMPKILVYGPRPKKARRKLRGHRQAFTTLKIKEITIA